MQTRCREGKCAGRLGNLSLCVLLHLLVLDQEVSLLLLPVYQLIELLLLLLLQSIQLLLLLLLQVLLLLLVQLFLLCPLVCLVLLDLPPQGLELFSLLMQQAQRVADGVLPQGRADAVAAAAAAA